jgi:hypothetical protein
MIKYFLLCFFIEKLSSLENSFDDISITAVIISLLISPNISLQVLYKVFTRCNALLVYGFPSAKFRLV